MKDARVEGLKAWARANHTYITESAQLIPVSDDASFRRYFRFADGESDSVFVDAPPEHEDNDSFQKIAAALATADLCCPHVSLIDLEQGYMEISDLGDRIYLDEMREHPDQIPTMYSSAVDALVRLLHVQCAVPVYSEAKLLEEMSLFPEWFLSGQLNIPLDQSVIDMFEGVFQLLIVNAASQPQRFVHRDYHCRNLMVVEHNGPGILDFQDAVIGPVVYDLVSLYKDCYFRFDRSIVEAAVADFHARLVELGLVDDDAPVLRWFDLMGVQRHLKCAGIFSRLNLRDGKPGYLPDIPLVIDYIVEVAGLYHELGEMGIWLEEVVVPRLAASKFQR